MCQSIMRNAIHAVPKCERKKLFFLFYFSLYFYQTVIPGCSLKTLFYRNSWLTGECVVLWLWFKRSNHTVLPYKFGNDYFSQIRSWCSSGLLSTCILGKAEHMLAFWQGQVDINADTHASSTYQRIQINSLFGRISASAFDTRRREGGCIEKLERASRSLQEEGATETCY